MILAIVQARMLSSRLTGKVMLEVMGKPLIGYLIQRLRASKRIDNIILATSIDASNDRLCAYAAEQGVLVHRGSEDDVLDRYYKAALGQKAKVIVRITGDCPLIDPALCDQLINAYFQEKVDYAHLDQAYAEGLDCEVFSFTALEQVYRKARLKSERGHVTLYFHNNFAIFKKFTLKNKTDDRAYRFTVDEQEDFNVVKAIIEGLSGRFGMNFGFQEIKSFLDAHPEISKANSHIIRNGGLFISLANDGEAKIDK